METPRIEKRIKELKSEVNDYSKKSPTHNIKDMLNNIFKSEKIYIAIPVIIFIFLVILNPTFFYVNKKDKEGNMKKSFSIKIFLITWFLISSVLVLSLFFYNFKKQ